MITNLLLYLALFFHGTTVIRSNFPPPNRGVIGYCFDLKCIYDSLKTVQEIDPVVVSLISKSFVDDSYLALYLGSIVDLFDFSMVRPDLQVVFLILQAPSDLLFMDSAFRLMQLLPLKSILITIEHGAQSLSVKSLKVAYDLGILPKVFFHLNHEKPWGVEDPMSLDKVFVSIEACVKFYDSFSLVMRNYYYQPLQSSSFYLPVLLPYHGYVIGNSSSALFMESMQRKPSQRSILCHFQGRLDYSQYKMNSVGKIVKVKGDDHLSYAHERRALVKMIKESKGGPLKSCSVKTIEANYMTTSYVEVYEQYVSTMIDTVFVLSPAGNNPETFRHYEALELGAIPIMVRTTDEQKNFMNYDLWVKYPGPVLDSWDDLEGFLASTAASDVDKLQAELSEWYEEFKTETRRRLGEKLVATFEVLQRQEWASTTAAADADDHDDDDDRGGRGRGRDVKARGLDEAYVYDAFPYDLTTGELKQQVTSHQVTSDQVKPKYKPMKKVSTVGSDYSDVIMQLFDIVNGQEQRINELEKRLLDKKS